MCAYESLKVFGTARYVQCFPEELKNFFVVLGMYDTFSHDSLRLVGDSDI